MEILVCKVCSCVVPPEHLDDGRALRNGGEVLCASCCRSTQMTKTGSTSARRPAAGGSTRVLITPASSTSSRSSARSPAPAKLPPGVVPRKPKLTRVADDAAPAPASASGRLRPEPASMSIGLAPAPVPKRPQSSVTQRANVTAILPTATISVRRKQALLCGLCRSAVTEEDLSAGRAQEASGRITCGTCLSAVSRARTRRLGIALSVLALMIAAYFIVPMPTLFVAALIGIALIAGGALLFDMASVQRLGLVFAGLILSVLSFWHINALRTAAEDAQQQQELASVKDEVRALLEANQPLEAQRYIKRLRSREAGANAAHRLADECDAMLLQWLDSNYADCDEVGRKLALALTEVFPSADGRSRRISAVQASEKRIALTLAAQEDRIVSFKGPEAQQELSFEAGFEEAWLVATHLYGSVRSLETLEIRLTLHSGKQHALKINAADYAALKDAKNPAAVLASARR